MCENEIWFLILFNLISIFRHFTTHSASEQNHGLNSEKHVNCYERNGGWSNCKDDVWLRKTVRKHGCHIRYLRFLKNALFAPKKSSKQRNQNWCICTFVLVISPFFFHQTAQPIWRARWSPPQACPPLQSRWTPWFRYVNVQRGSEVEPSSSATAKSCGKFDVNNLRMLQMFSLDGCWRARLATGRHAWRGGGRWKHNKYRT